MSEPLRDAPDIFSADGAPESDGAVRTFRWCGPGGLRTRFGRGIFPRRRLVAGHKEEVMKLYFAPGACSLPSNWLFGTRRAVLS